MHRLLDHIPNLEPHLRADAILRRGLDHQTRRRLTRVLRVPANPSDILHAHMLVRRAAQHAPLDGCQVIRHLGCAVYTHTDRHGGDQRPDDGGDTAEGDVTPREGLAEDDVGVLGVA